MTSRAPFLLLSLLALAGLPLAGCDDGGVGPIEVPSSYAFESRFSPGESSVAYGGQVFRHLLIEDLEDRIGSLDGDVRDATLTPTEDGQVVGILDFYFDFDVETSGAEAIRMSTEPALLHSTYGELTTGASLRQKLAGNDTATDHRDWSTEFEGWSDPAIAAHGGSIDTPTGLVEAIFETLEENAIRLANGESRASVDGSESDLPIHVTESGLDLEELTAKLLLSALAFHQAADDYLDSGTAGKGLESDNTEPEEGEPFTALEHAWDEGFGYFGASRRYGDFSLTDLAGAAPSRDFDGDGRVDLRFEHNTGTARYAASRDLGAGATTSFVADAWSAFREGRTIIVNAGGALDAGEQAALRAQRDRAIMAWEGAQAATVIHYINEVLQDLAAYGAAGHGFLEVAKHFSEAKGYALGFQFNPRSPVTREQLRQIHALLGDAPVVPGAGDAAAYAAELVEARGLIGAAFGFTAAQLGDAGGEGGW